MTEHLPWLAEELNVLEHAGLRRVKRIVTPLPDGWCVADGKRLRNFSSNDYLNLTQDLRVIKAATQATAEFGAGSRASALVSGRSDWHARLEERLARFEHQDAAVLFPSGYAANVGTVSALAGSEDILFCDALNHASLIDGCRLSRAHIRLYRHNALETLESELSKAGGYRRRYIVTDGVFSMDGNLAPLPELCCLADQFDAAVIVDEAHGTGVLGENGRGVTEMWHVEDRVAVRIGTLSKAVGCLGGFVAGRRSLIDWLWNRARTQMFSTALPPSVCAAACQAIEIIEQEPVRRQQVQTLASRLRSTLQESGLTTVPTGRGPIIPVILNDPERAVATAKQLEEHGFLVAAIRPPTVPQGTSRLRITLSAAHNAQDVDRLVQTLRSLVDTSPDVGMQLVKRGTETQRLVSSQPEE